jgi:glycerol kinase
MAMREPKAVLALDQGTTSSRAIVFNQDGLVLGMAQHEFAQHYPQPGWVEHDPEDIWRSQLQAARDAVVAAGIGAGDIAAVGLTNQRETTVCWDKETGRSLGNAIVWQCRRTAERCHELISQGYEEFIRARTGLPLDPYFSATKLEWILKHHPDAPSLLAEDRLRAGTVDSFLAWRLSKGRCHVTDYSNASRTMLFDIRSLEWEDELLDLFGIPRSVLPQPQPSSMLLGHIDAEWLGAEIPIAGIVGDQQAALFGQGCFNAGDVKNTYGTGCFLLMNVGELPVCSTHGLVSTVAWGLGPDRKDVRYALEGSVFIAGAAVQWLRDGLGIVDSADEIGALASLAKDNAGLYFVPALTGLGAPFWDPAARGLLIGITRGTTRAHIARATEEAICYQTRAVLDAMVRDAGVSPSFLQTDGGATGDDFLLQFQADVLGIPVQRSALRETTGFGAAALAGIAVGFWSLDKVAHPHSRERSFSPLMDKTTREALYREWCRAAERAMKWSH